MPGDGRLFHGTDVGGLDVLVAKTLNFVLSLLLIKADLGGGHDLTGALALVVKLHLKISEGVVTAAPASGKLEKRHGAGGNDGNDGVGALLAFARHSDLIAGGPTALMRPLSSFSKALRRASVPLSFTSWAKF